MSLLLLDDDAPLSVREDAIAIAVLTKLQVVILALLGRTDDLPARQALRAITAVRPFRTTVLSCAIAGPAMNVAAIPARVQRFARVVIVMLRPVHESVANLAGSARRLPIASRDVTISRASGASLSRSRERTFIMSRSCCNDSRRPPPVGLVDLSPLGCVEHADYIVSRRACVGLTAEHPHSMTCS